MKEQVKMKVAIGFLSAMVLLGTGCSSVSRMADAVSAIGSSSSGVSVKVEARQGGAPIYRSGASIRLAVPAPRDNRPTAASNPAKAGNIRATVMDMHGSELLLGQSVSDLTGSALRGQLGADGFAVTAPGQASDFELSTVIRSFELNIAGRDELSLAVEASLREVRSGEVIWTGLVSEKSDRYAGVMGNSRSSIESYLSDGLGELAQKTSASVRAVLLQAYPKTVSTTGAPSQMAAMPGVTHLKTVAPREGVAAAPAPVAPVRAPLPPAAAPERPAVAVATRPAVVLPAAAAPAAVVQAPAAGYGYFSAITMPTRVKVYSDDIYYGLTPLKVMVPAGVMTFEFRFDGYKSVTQKVSVRRGETTVLELKLKK